MAGLKTVLANLLGASAFGDEAVMFGAAIDREIEDRFAVVAVGLQITAMDNQLVL